MRGLVRLGVLLVVGLLGMVPGFMGVGTALAAGTTYYVAVGGTATGCAAAESRGAPFATVQAALDCAAADTRAGAATATSPDTVAIAAGRYDEHLTASADVRLVGAGDDTVVDGMRSGTVVTVNGGSSVGISHLTIADGAAFAGGGILNSGTLTLTNVVVRGNAASFAGGGIGNLGALTLIESVVRGNTSGLHGGGIANDGTLTLRNSAVRGNTGGFGGGICNGGTLTLDHSVVSGNAGLGEGGGGIANEPHGTATLTDSAVKHNTATAGGGILNVGRLRLTDSAVMDNTATNDGGGIDQQGGTVTLINSRVRKNRPDNCAPPGGVVGCTD